LQSWYRDTTLTRVERNVTTALIAWCMAALVAQGMLLFGTFYGDPSIYLIFARNIAQGDLFSFNPGIFSSGSTGPLWSLLLAPTFLLPGSVGLAKLLGLVTTLLAFWLTFRACNRVSGSSLASVLATGTVAWAAAIPAVMLYESGLAQCLASAAILLTVRLTGPETGANQQWAWVGLLVVWAALPLTRPDAVILVALNVFVLLVTRRADPAARRRLIITATLAAVPSLLYFGTSYIQTGHFSVSGLCRGFAVQERAPALAGIRYSPAALRALLAPSLAVLVGSALWAFENRGDERPPLALRAWFATTWVSYLVVLTFVVPTVDNVQRYLIPALPLLAVMASAGLRDLLAVCRRGHYRLLPAALVVGLLLVPAWVFLTIGKQQRAVGYDFDAIMERAVAETLNGVAAPDSTVLAYEVQLRYFLRPDVEVLSLDGIIDGKVAPYLESGDMHSFLLRYQPDYWLANDAVFYRPFLAGSVLNRVVQSIGDREGASVEVDGIVFTNVKVNTEPRIRDFAGYRQLFQLRYRSREGVDDPSTDSAAPPMSGLRRVGPDSGRSIVNPEAASAGTVARSTGLEAGQARPPAPFARRPAPGRRGSSRFSPSSRHSRTLTSHSRADHAIGRFLVPAQELNLRFSRSRISGRTSSTGGRLIHHVAAP